MQAPASARQAHRGTDAVCKKTMCLLRGCIQAGATVRASPVCMLEAAMTCALCPGKNDSPCRPTRLVQPSALFMEAETLYEVEGFS